MLYAPILIMRTIFARFVVECFSEKVLLLTILAKGERANKPKPQWLDFRQVTIISRLQDILFVMAPR